MDNELLKRLDELRSIDENLLSDEDYSEMLELEGMLEQEEYLVMADWRM